MKLLFPLLCLLFFACKPKDTTTETTTPDTSSAEMGSEVPGLKLMWETEKKLTTAESVLYDKTNNLLYVSCINGTPELKKDNDGFIARLGLDGKLITEKWVTGLSAPKGMGMVGNTLYVTDIDRLVSINITTGKITKTWDVKGATYLNDIATTPDGKIYFTDTNSSTIYTLTDSKVATVYTDTIFGGTNGIYVDGDHLILAGFMSGIVFRLDPNTKEIQKVAEEIPGGDGVEPYRGGWMVSNWNGEVYHIDSKGMVTEILDSQEAKLNSADIEVIEEKNMLLIPTFFGNGVTAYELLKQ